MLPDLEAGNLLSQPFTFVESSAKGNVGFSKPNCIRFRQTQSYVSIICIVNDRCKQKITAQKKILMEKILLTNGCVRKIQIYNAKPIFVDCKKIVKH